MKIFHSFLYETTGAIKKLDQVTYLLSVDILRLNVVNDRFWRDWKFVSITLEIIVIFTPNNTLLTYKRNCMDSPTKTNDI